MKEEYRPIVGYEGYYEVSNLGNIRSCKRVIIDRRCKRLLKSKPIVQKDDTHGYLIVVLWKNNKSKKYKVHRLVAQTFIPNPNNFRDINHKDENKYNNNVANLEWISHKANLNYGSRNERANITRSKKVGQYIKGTNKLLATYINAYIAEEQTGICECNISACCRNKRKTAGGYCWKFMK